MPARMNLPNGFADFIELSGLVNQAGDFRIQRPAKIHVTDAPWNRDHTSFRHFVAQQDSRIERIGVTFGNTNHRDVWFEAASNLHQPTGIRE